MTRPQAFQDIAENLAFLDNWEDRYRYIIELGQALPPLAEAEKNSATKVNGCVSQVWLVTERIGDLVTQARSRSSDWNTRMLTTRSTRAFVKTTEQMIK